MSQLHANDEREEMLQVQKRISSRTLACAVVAALILVGLGENTVAKGLLLGTCFSILNFCLMGIFIPMSVSSPRRKLGLTGLASILLRYAVLAVPLIVGIKSAKFNFAAVVVGVFGVQIMTLIEYLVIRPASEGR
jgi:hypothetical protein